MNQSTARCDCKTRHLDRQPHRHERKAGPTSAVDAVHCVLSRALRDAEGAARGRDQHEIARRLQLIVLRRGSGARADRVAGTRPPARNPDAGRWNDEDLTTPAPHTGSQETAPPSPAGSKPAAGHSVARCCRRPPVRNEKSRISAASSAWATRRRVARRGSCSLPRERDLYPPGPRARRRAASSRIWRSSNRRVSKP